MNSPTFFLTMSAALFVIGVVEAFQVAPDPDKRFKEAIQKVKIDKFPSKFTIVDDTRFPNEISSKALGVRPLSESIALNYDIRPQKPVPRKLFGFDGEPTEYWFHNKIHTFGNTNVFGGFHAACGPIATRLIDDLAYEGVNVRSVIANDLRKMVKKKNAYIIDLCCGVGMSTRALASAFHDAAFICGIDTSPEMISMARFITKHNGAFNAIQGLSNSTEFKSSFMNLVVEIKNTVSGTLKEPNCSYAIGNAERIKAPKMKFDLVTIMYAFHEIPKSPRYRIIREARRLLKPGGKLAIVDISPVGYEPSPSMLAGEPYILEYQKNISNQIEKIQGFHELKTKDVIPGLVTMWTLTRNEK